MIVKLFIATLSLKAKELTTATITWLKAEPPVKVPEMFCALIPSKNAVPEPALKVPLF